MKTLQSRIKDVYELSDNAPSLSMTELEYLEAYHHWHHKFDIPEMVSVIRELEAKLAQAVQALEHYQTIDNELEKFSMGFAASTNTVNIGGVARKTLEAISGEGASDVK